MHLDHPLLIPRAKRLVPVADPHFHMRNEMLVLHFRWIEQRRLDEDEVPRQHLLLCKGDWEGIEEVRLVAATAPEAKLGLQLPQHLPDQPAAVQIQRCIVVRRDWIRVIPPAEEARSAVPSAKRGEGGGDLA